MNFITLKRELPMNIQQADGLPFVIAGRKKIRNVLISN